MARAQEAPAAASEEEMGRAGRAGAAAGRGGERRGRAARAGRRGRPAEEGWGRQVRQAMQDQAGGRVRKQARRADSHSTYVCIDVDGSFGVGVFVSGL